MHGFANSFKSEESMNVSPELQAIIEGIPADFALPDADFNDVRAMFEPFHNHPVSADFQVEITEYGGVRCGRYHLDGVISNITAFHCHGGAFVACPLDVFHFYAEIIARETCCDVVMPDYRLAPEHPYPVAHDVRSGRPSDFTGLRPAGRTPADVYPGRPVRYCTRGRHPLCQ